MALIWSQSLSPSGRVPAGAGLRADEAPARQAAVGAGWRWLGGAQPRSPASTRRRRQRKKPRRRLGRGWKGMEDCGKRARARRVVASGTGSPGVVTGREKHDFTGPPKECGSCETSCVSPGVLPATVSGTDFVTRPPCPVGAYPNWMAGRNPALRQLRAGIGVS